MLDSYHAADSETGATDAGELSACVFSALPTAQRLSRAGDVHPVYQAGTKNKPFRFTWRELMAKGAYNHVYYADIEDSDGGTSPGVIRVTVQSDKDLRVHMLENVLHALMYQHRDTRSMVVPLRCAFKLRRSGHPPYTLGTVLDDPGRGDLGGWVERHMVSDEQMFSVITQIAWMLYKCQKALRFEHRDLKCDNVMVADQEMQHDTIAMPEFGVRYQYPTLGLRCLFIDFGMARVELNGEYLACDCVHHHRTSFNQCHDLQNWCCTLLEDYDECLAERAPRFKRWLVALCRPLFVKVRETWPKYDEGKSSSTRHKQLSLVVNREVCPEFAPPRMLEALAGHWGRAHLRE
jgi:serine/threonine protein kinase